MDNLLNYQIDILQSLVNSQVSTNYKGKILLNASIQSSSFSTGNLSSGKRVTLTRDRGLQLFQGTNTLSASLIGNTLSVSNIQGINSGQLFLYSGDLYSNITLQTNAFVAGGAVTLTTNLGLHSASLDSSGKFGVESLFVGNLTSGRVPYVGASSILDNANHIWDNTNNRLLLGLASSDVSGGKLLASDIIGVVSAITNAIGISVWAGSGIADVSSFKTGSGTVPPLTLSFGGTPNFKVDGTNSATFTAALIYHNGALARMVVDNSDLGSGTKKYLYLA